MRWIETAFPLTLLLLSLISGPSKVASAQENPLPAAALVAYQCTFDLGTNSSIIRAALMGSDSLPLPRAAFTANVTPTGSTEALPATQVTADIAPSRQPLQMILVMDVTDTVPVQQIVSTLSSTLIPQLQAEDRIALITFGDSASPPTQFYTDKNRLINEHMLELIPAGGENRLYDAMLKAVSSFPFSSETRKVVLVLTDSGRRDVQQATTSEIIARANRDKVQVYPIGFYTRDKPDDAELLTIANGTGGYSWIYNEERNSRASIEAAVSEFLNDFVRTLNGEIVVTVDMQGQTPDANGRVGLTIAIDSNNDPQLTDQVSCPIQQLTHEIRFIEQTIERPIAGTIDIGVAIESDLRAEELNVVFRVNNEIVQNSSETIYTFNAATVQPGYYNIGAQLRDRNNNTLATTPATIRLYAQQPLVLKTANAQTTALSGTVQFEASGTPGFTLAPVNFTLAPASAPGQAFNLGTAPFQADGRALLTIENLNATIQSAFPNANANEQWQVNATSSGISPEDPVMAFSNTLLISLQPESTVTTSAAPQPFRLQFDESLPILITIFLLALNLLLLRTIGRRRIMRIIDSPDHHELSPRLMTITVCKDEIKQPHTLTKKTLYVGRGSANDINLGDSPSISRQHGVIMWRKKAWYYSNRKNRLTTRINGRRYTGLIFHKLTPVTELEIGDTLLIFHSSAQQDVSEFIRTNL